MSAVLEVGDLRKSFGGITAVDGVSLSVEEGEIVGVIGPNGSGKSTLFDCILGQLLPTGGTVRVDGREVTGMRPCDLNRLGVSRTFQMLQVFPLLSVRENLILAGQEHRGSMLRRLLGAGDAGLGAAAQTMIEFFRLQHLADEFAGELSYGQQKLLDVAMAFMSGPRLVLLDEPAAGVNPVLVETIERHIRRLHAQGLSFLVVEHDMPLVMRLCDPVIVLDRGRKIAEGPALQVQQDANVLDAYLGA